MLLGIKRIGRRTVYPQPQQSRCTLARSTAGRRVSASRGSNRMMVPVGVST